MSRIGKIPLKVPEKVQVTLGPQTIAVQGPLGKLEFQHQPRISIVYDEPTRTLTVQRDGDDRTAKALHGLTRALVQNMLVGVTAGYERKLEIVGVGYIAAIQKGVLQLRVGLANELQVPIPGDLTVTCPDQQHVLIKGIDKQRVSHFAAAVRALRKPEPYKGKGIRYDGEAVRRKQGKATVK